MSTLRTAAAALAVMIVPAMATAQESDSTTVDTKRIYEVGEIVNGRPVLDSVPTLLNCPKFNPQDLRGDETTFSFERAPTIERGGGGIIEATLEYIVDVGGKVERRNIKVVRSSHREYERSLEYWVRDCKYNPGKIGKTPVRVRVRRDVKLRIDR